LESNDNPSQRFADLVKLSGLDRKFIDKAQERRMLEEAITRLNLPLSEARGLMHSVAEDNGYTFESDTGKRIKQVLSRHAGRKGKVSRRNFNNTATVLRDISEDHISEPEARRQIKRIMIENGWQPRRTAPFWTRRWFRQIEA
jgi:hypothetical protein